MNWTIMRKNLHIPKHNIHKKTSKADTIQNGFTSPLLPHEVGSKAQIFSLHGSSLKPKYNIFFFPSKPEDPGLHKMDYRN